MARRRRGERVDGPHLRAACAGSPLTKGVLALSGRWGYDVRDPHVLCRAYRATGAGGSASIFFRETRLSNAIGFDYQGYADYRKAAEDFVTDVKERYARRLSGGEDHVLSVILDGENAWGGYRDDGRPFLEALYRLLAHDAEIRTVTFREYLEGDVARRVAPHPMEQQHEVHELFTGAWIDEAGSAPGVDLGTWIDEEEENRAWELLRRTRDFLEREGATPEAFEPLYVAEGSDWFWWLGADQDSGRDEEFDDLFRTHLKNVYRATGASPPEDLDIHIVPRSVLWTHVAPVRNIQPGDRMSVRTHCPGVVEWSVDGEPPRSWAVTPVGGAMAGASRYQSTLGPFPESVAEIRFRFECRHEGCPGTELCCDPRFHTVRIVEGSRKRVVTEMAEQRKNAMGKMMAMQPQMMQHMREGKEEGNEKTMECPMMKEMVGSPMQDPANSLTHEEKRGGPVSELNYGYEKTLPNETFDGAVQQVTEALRNEGFGVLTEIDVRQTLKKKLDVDFRSYVIFGACNPVLARQALDAEPHIGLLLPCNVVVQEAPSGGVTVSIADPRVMFQLVGNPALEPVVEEAELRLHRVIEALG